MDIEKSDNSLKKVNSVIEIDFEDEKLAKLIYNSVAIEFKTAVGYRSQMSLKLEENCIVIEITAKDSTSFRASINSAIKWISLSYEIVKLTKNNS